MSLRVSSQTLLMAGLLALPVLPPLQQRVRADSSAEEVQPLHQEAGSAEGSTDTTPPETGAGIPQAWAMDARRHDALEFSAGTFTPAGYGPDSRNGLCTALTLCSDEGLFGSVFSLTYVRRLRNNNQHNLDLDVSGYVGIQSVDGPSRTFGMLSVVPTYRLRLPRRLSRLTAGIGAGVNVAIGDMPSEDPNVPVNSQLNLELALTPRMDSKFEITFALEHRCTLFGLLNTKDGSLSGSQWYTVGLRRWF